MEGTWYTPDQEPDDSETKGEKKDKKDAREVMKKASLLELFQAHQAEAKAEKEAKEDNEASEPDQNGEALDEPAEMLTEEEQQVVSEQLVDDRLEAVEAELGQVEGNETDVAAIAATMYLEEVARHLDNGEPLDETVLEAASEEVAHELAVEDSEITDTESADEQPESDDTSVTPPVPPTPPTPSTGNGGNGGTPPPSYPTNPSFPIPSGPPYSAGLSGPNFNQQPTATATAERTNEPERHSHAKYVLAGGIVGYLLGRRRGRIKTEAKLVPIQQKLERDVNDLREKLLIKEQQVRKAAQEQVKNVHVISSQEALLRVQNERQKRAESLERLVETDSKRPEKLGKYALLLQKQPEQTPARHLQDRQLFEIAQKIPFEGSTVAELYRQGRLDIQDMREIAQAFLAGKSYEQLTIKALHDDSYQPASDTVANQQPTGDAMSRLADLLPEHMAHRVNNTYWPPEKKEAHIMARVGIVAAFTTLVVVVAVIVTLWMFNAL